jgi:diaminohydroxyphosphoribosylaminopyrimidine deaminase/5-amino-6-(5-phosphoribosylamino)uracil reductase
MSAGFDRADHAFMARALQLARRGRYTTFPNPRVGCVLVRDGEIVGEGWHRRAGEPHAERIALAAAGERAHGATAYVTLEPCSHHGRTPPCADGLIEVGVARVVAAMEDPNPQVAGQGLARLRNAGIRVETGLLEADARALNPGFIRRMQGERPWMRLKLAASLDGRTAMASGESQWITGPAARRDVQFLRARSAAVLTGIGTVLADDPSLNVRLDSADLGLPSDLPVRQPLRVVLDSSARTPPDARLLRLPGSVLICVAKGADGGRVAALERAGAEICRLPTDASGHPAWPAVMDALRAREIDEVLLECGATLAGSALQAGVVDELVLYLAPQLLGDAARGLVHLPGVERLEQRIELAMNDVRQVGEDLRLTLGLRQSGTP